MEESRRAQLIVKPRKWLTASGVGLQADRERIESLLSLAKVLCPRHGRMAAMQSADGRILFWCGCTKTRTRFLEIGSSAN